MFVGLLVCSSLSQAFFIDTWATGGANLALNDRDWTDGWSIDGPMTDFVAEATHNSTVDPYRDQGYARGSLTEAGVELKSRSYAPDVYANSLALINDQFTVITISGLHEELLDAVLNFELTGTIEVSGTQDGRGVLSIDMYARHDNQPYLDSKIIRYEVSRDPITNEYVGFNDNDNWDNLFQVYPSITGGGLNYNFDIPLNLDLSNLTADEPVLLSIRIGTSGKFATADFSSTLQTNQDIPFVLTSSPSGYSYLLDTDFIEVENVGLFGNLDGARVDECEGDFDPDDDVDGVDLASLTDSAAIDIDIFAGDYGRTNCP
jgi:hypothetical protein